MIHTEANYTEEERECPCREQGCPEHPYHHGDDHTYQQHHAPEDHMGNDPCNCTVYAEEAQDA